MKVIDLFSKFDEDVLVTFDKWWKQVMWKLILIILEIEGVGIKITKRWR